MTFRTSITGAVLVTGLVAYLVAVSIAVSAGGSAPDSGRARQSLSFRDTGPAVAFLNDALTEAGFNADEGDVFGKKTRHAVYAFQKHHELPTSGEFTAFMWDLLDDPIELPRRQEADRVEVDLGKQVLYVVRSGEVVVILPVSSGSGDGYIGSNGRRQIADTPEGVFKFQRRILGVRKAPLGTLYNPYYFRGGIAVHGSPSVPNYPASHGCIRTTLWDMELLLDHLEIGQTIYVYGEQKRPPQDDATPRRRYV